jgi:hypothetical protein
VQVGAACVWNLAVWSDRFAGVEFLQMINGNELPLERWGFYHMSEVVRDRSDLSVVIRQIITALARPRREIMHLNSASLSSVRRTNGLYD